MTAGAAEALADELRRATVALEGIDGALDEARLGSREATQTQGRLRALRDRAQMNTSLPLRAMAEVRRDMRSARRSLRRPLVWRIRGLQLRLFWRVARVILLALLMVGLLLFAMVWVARNRDWIFDSLRPGSGLSVPEAPVPATPVPATPVPAMPDPGGPADQVPAAPVPLHSGGQP